MAKFPVVSPGPPQSQAIKRLNRVMQRAQGRGLIARAAVFVCKKTVGSSLFSAHSFGKAVDYMLKVANRASAEKLAALVVRQATKRTAANFLRPVKNINFVIGGQKQWVRGAGWSPYTRGGHDNHVHAAEHGSTNVVPACAR